MASHGEEPSENINCHWRVTGTGIKHRTSTEGENAKRKGSFP